MGITSSSTSSTSSTKQKQKQDDIYYLGQRCPFGDDELSQMYDAYMAFVVDDDRQQTHHEENHDDGNNNQPQQPHQQRSPSSSSSSSFLTEFGVQSYRVALERKDNRKNRTTTTTTQQQQQQQQQQSPAASTRQQHQQLLKDRRLILTAMEEQILPSGFSKELYRQCFNEQQLDYSNNSSSNNPNDNNQNTEMIRREQLEHFFDGLSNMTRRGRKPALDALIRCCSDSGQSSSSSPFSSPSLLSIDPLKFVTLGYRIGLATAFLKTVCENEMKRNSQNNNRQDNHDNNDSNDDDTADDEIDPSIFLPPTTSSTTTTTKTATETQLQSLAQSLEMIALKRQQRTTMSYGTDTPLFTTTPSNSNNHNNNGKTTTPAHVVVEPQDVYEWADYVAPMFSVTLPSLLNWILFPTKSVPTERTTFDYPMLLQSSSIFDDNDNDLPKESSTMSTTTSPSLFTFACLSPALGGEYYRLYTSASDGLSFNRLQNALLGYGGPTLIIIQSTTHITSADDNTENNNGTNRRRLVRTFGAFTASPWKESKDFYGNHDCFLFQLHPQTAVYRPSGGGGPTTTTTTTNSSSSSSSNHFMYCNSFARSRGYDQQAHGIGFGGTVHQPRLFLDESFDNCYAGSADLTFDKGPLLGTATATTSSSVTSTPISSMSSSTFEIDTIEVWGVGGSRTVQESLQARTKQREYRQATIQKARKVDKAAFLDDLKSGLIESKAFAHREQIRGREGVAPVDEDEVFNRIKPGRNGS